MVVVVELSCDTISQSHRFLRDCGVGPNMTLSVLVRGPEGLVFAADSRSLVTFKLTEEEEIPINFDGTNKILTFSKPHNFVAAVTFGLGSIADRPVYSFMPEIEATITEKRRLSVQEYANKLSTFFVKEWNKQPTEKKKDYKGDPITFWIGGFNEGDPLSHTYEIKIPFKQKPTELPQVFDINYGGQPQLANRLFCGYDFDLPKKLSEASPLTEGQIKEIAKPFQLKFKFAAMGLQGYVDIAKLFISTTIEIQRLTCCLRSCGGPIDVVTITRRDGLRYIQHKAH